MAPKKIRYQSRSVERSIGVPREQVWPEVVTLLGNGRWSVNDLSVEPPWRIAVELGREGSELEILQSTVLIRDDGPTCHVAWGLVFDPEPSDPGLRWAEGLLVTMASELEELAARLA